MTATSPSSLDRWLRGELGLAPNRIALFERALTHPSTGGDDYQRLEFLGDRVLGLTLATWLYDLHPDEPEGKLNRRFSTLVSRVTCAEIARAIGAAGHVRLGKQAAADGAADSDNVLGDVVEALIGALYLDAGLEAAEAFIRASWAPLVETMDRAPMHPKSALQEWAAANGFDPPVYTIVTESGPQHSLEFTIRTEIPGRASAEATGPSKRDAETAAAAALLEQLT